MITGLYDGKLDHAPASWRKTIETGIDVTVGSCWRSRPILMSCRCRRM
jgi:hypothetical protein